jgi:hypothetical protein
MEEKRESEEKIEEKERPMEYKIGDKTYIQKPLYLGQIKMLTKTMKGIKWPQQLDISAIMEAIIDIIPEAFSIVLIEKGKESISDLKNRDLASVQEEFEFVVNTVTILEVVSDFLSCNPVNSLTRILKNVIDTTYTRTPPITEQTQTDQNNGTGSMSTSSTSVEETLPEETESSGVTH